LTVLVSSRSQCIDQSNHGEKTEQISQMADIYACAQLTIVAASGEDSDHGILHTSTKSNSSFFPVSLGSLQLLPVPKQSEALKALRTSTWASRAWTFQECYFSRRRLFFVGGQVIYICNYRNARLMPAGWSPSQENSILQSRDTRFRVMELMRAYSGRQMTYESDALAAIVSSLNTLIKGTMKHIWGLPLRRLGPPEVIPASYSDGELGLFWRHELPCYQRSGFPSWSPVAWNMKIEWFPVDVTNTWRVVLVVQPESTTNQSSMLTYDSGNFEIAPRYLRVTADMACLRLVLAPVLKEADAIPDLNDQRLFLAFPLDSNLDIILHEPYWDIDPHSLDPAKPIIGILSSSEKPHLPSNGPIVLLVQLRDSFYERIGILQLEFVLNYSARLFLHDGKYVRFCSGDSGELLHYQVSGVENMDDLESKDIKLPFLEHSKWRSFFVTDTIVLG
jgi:hypothetical protein